MLDVGSGAGFPAVPLKIYIPGLRVHLLEANSRKVSFLKQVIRLLDLRETEAIRGRIEKDGTRLHTGGYHLITARALTRLRQTVAWCAPFLSPGGLLIGFLGAGVNEELEECEKILSEERVITEKIIPYLLPGKNFKRHTIIFRKRR
jgi:16S rRNA (guanine527-N7)-methyltransferase